MLQLNMQESQNQHHHYDYPIFVLNSESTNY